MCWQTWASSGEIIWGCQVPHFQGFDCTWICLCSSHNVQIYTYMHHYRIHIYPISSSFISQLLFLWVILTLLQFFLSNLRVTRKNILHTVSRSWSWQCRENLFEMGPQDTKYTWAKSSAAFSPINWGRNISTGIPRLLKEILYFSSKVFMVSHYCICFQVPYK